MIKWFTHYTSVLSIVSLLFFSCSETNETNIILNENFDTNTRGWIQENADFHTLEIKDGFYFIQNKDSSSVRTSCRSLDISYLYSLPEKYSIETSMAILESDLDTSYCGLILEGNTFIYEFTFYNTGEVIVEQYDYNTKKWATFSEMSSLEVNHNIEEFNVQIDFDGWNFELYLNDNWLGKGNMSSKNWSRIAPFTGKFTSIQVDYLRINQIEGGNDTYD